jgi:signal transduction histidine kinase
MPPPKSRSLPPRRRTGLPPTRAGRRLPVSAAPAPDEFFRNMVWSLRTGVLAITRDGRVAVLNEVAYRILNVRPRAGDLGRPYTEVLRDHPDVARILSGAFELAHLPNRAELRLKATGKVIGYTLSQVTAPPDRAVTGAALFFKDLTRVEQIEERERLRDRLAALGEMAAAIAHEVKNPLAGIEVMAGLLKRQLPHSADAQTILTDIIKEAKMANAIVLEVLEFVRPIRLQVEEVSLADAVHDAISMAESHMPRGGTTVQAALPAALPAIHGDPHQLRQLFTNLLTNAFEALGGAGRVAIRAEAIEEDHSGVSEPGAPTALVVIDIDDDGPGVPAEVTDKIFSPFFTTKPQGSGLGLAIVRKIVDAHDGRIDLRARATGGTRVRVTLPVRGSQRPFDSRPGAAQRAGRRRS